MKKDNQTKKLETYEFYVEGMHCAACEIFIEKKFRKVEGVKSVDAMLNSGTVRLEGNIGESAEEIANRLTDLIKDEGYLVHISKQNRKKFNINEYIYALPIAFFIILLFLILQRTGILEINTKGSSYSVIFIIGLIASLSSCMAVTGGLVLSLSANYAKELRARDRIKPQIMFHISRIIGFFILGGLIGFLGQAVSIVKISSFLLSIFLGAITFGLIKSQNIYKKILPAIGLGIATFIIGILTLDQFWSHFVLSAITATLMLILGLNLLELFEFTKKLQFKMPKAFSHTILKTENINSRFTPIFLGLSTFFLPCGYTISMQTNALGSGTAMEGGLIMFVFALGTFPVLALISFASVNFAKSLQSGTFFKVAGILVLFFALINIIGALIAVGLLPPILNI